MSKKKILFIVNDFGSFSIFISELCLHLVREYGVEVSVILPRSKVIEFEDKLDYRSAGIQLHFVNITRGFNIFRHLLASLKINKIIKTVKPDLVHAHFTAAIFSTVLFKSRQVRIWGTYHGLGYVVSSGFRKVLLKWIESFGFFRLQKIIVLNEMDYLEIPSVYKSRTIKATSIGLGCDLNQFDFNRFTAKDKNSLKLRLNIQDQIVLAFTGRFVYFKGFDLVAKIFIKLTKKYPDTFKLILIGGKDPFHSTGLTRQEEKDLFEHPDVCHTGFTREVDKYLSIADIFVFPSKKEGVPVSITEALAMGLPTVTFNSRGCNDLVRNAYNGFLIDPNNTIPEEPDAFIEAIEQIAFNKELYTKLHKNAMEDRDKLSRQHFINEQVLWYKKELNL